MTRHTKLQLLHRDVTRLVHEPVELLVEVVSRRRLLPLSTPAARTAISVAVNTYSPPAASTSCAAPAAAVSALLAWLAGSAAPRCVARLTANPVFQGPRSAAETLQQRAGGLGLRSTRGSDELDGDRLACRQHHTG